MHYIVTLTIHLAYGMYISETKVLSPAETSMVVIASMLPLDLAFQVKWHMKGLLVNKGTEVELRQVLDLSVEAVNLSGIKLQAGVPDIEEVLKDASV
jgi:alkylhydroperoxidase/carboxymuconolactone decarboxylase family protein YurZ